jgi:hypothetical protein
MRGEPKVAAIQAYARAEVAESDRPGKSDVEALEVLMQALRRLGLI